MDLARRAAVAAADAERVRLEEHSRAIKEELMRSFDRPGKESLLAALRAARSAPEPERVPLAPALVTPATHAPQPVAFAALRDVSGRCRARHDQERAADRDYEERFLGPMRPMRANWAAAWAGLRAALAPILDTGRPVTNYERHRGGIGAALAAVGVVLTEHDAVPAVAAHVAAASASGAGSDAVSVAGRLGTLVARRGDALPDSPAVAALLLLGSMSATVPQIEAAVRDVLADPLTRPCLGWLPCLGDLLDPFAPGEIPTEPFEPDADGVWRQCGTNLLNMARAARILRPRADRTEARSIAGAVGATRASVAEEPGAELPAPRVAQAPSTTPEPRDVPCVWPKHGETFEWVECSLGKFLFNARQAKVVQTIWADWGRGGHGVSNTKLLSQVGDSATKVRDIFKGHEAWGKLLGPVGKKGITALYLPHPGAAG